ncbi:MAG: Bug family tripartite tricarboxylate transporter substrate binding protein, partial [Burkholderiales bacterium]
YPTKPVRFIVPYPPGGGTDLFARVLAAGLSQSLGQQLVVDNRSGAQGAIANAAVARAAPDGYTILLTEIGSVTMTPWLYESPGFDPVKDFAQVSLGVTYPNAAVAHPSLAAKNLKELAALAKAKPDAVKFASASSLSQLSGELFKMLADVKMLHVPYKGAGPATIDLVGGQVDVMFVTAASALPMVKAGKTRALVVTGPKRIAAMADVPTAKESGYPDFEVVGWFGVAAPANTSKEIVARLNREIRAVLKAPGIAEKLEAAGLDVAPSSPDEMTQMVRNDYARWGKVVKAVGIKPQ